MIVFIDCIWLYIICKMQYQSILLFIFIFYICNFLINLIFTVFVCSVFCVIYFFYIFVFCFLFSFLFCVVYWQFFFIGFNFLFKYKKCWNILLNYPRNNKHEQNKIIRLSLILSDCMNIFYTFFNFFVWIFF